MNRGDVILVRFPHPSGLRGKKRPAVIVQSDAYAGALGTLVVAEVTKNLTMGSDPACLLSTRALPREEPRAWSAIPSSPAWCS
jgi:mRNA-degrading endonuclease toxin of MazEF toxin-antitoxin module